MYDRSEFLRTIRKVQTQSHPGFCTGFQRDLSALLDNELPEEHARRSLAHLESCGHCEDFFEAIRLQALAHRDLAVPGSLATRLRRLRGQDLFEGMTDSEIIRRMATALYQLGKAYALLATDGEYLLSVSEEPVAVDAFRKGEMAEAARAVRATDACPLDAAVLKEGTDEHLEHSLQLLRECLRLKPKFAEARLYLGFVLQVQDRVEEAQGEYRAVLLQTDRPVNRAHAAIQLGMLYHEAGQHREALRVYRWVVASGLVHRQPKFAFVFYNMAIEHVLLGNLEAGAAMIRLLHGQYPETWEQAHAWLRQAPDVLARLQGDPQCRQLLQEAAPTLFAA